MKSVLLAFLLWSCAMISGALVPHAMAQCSGTQICGTGPAGASTARIILTGTPSKNQVFTISIGPTVFQVNTCSAGPPCDNPVSITRAGLAAKFANVVSGGSCTSETNYICSGNLPANWSTGPVVVVGATHEITLSYNGPGVAPSFTASGAQGQANISVTSTVAGTPTLQSLLGNSMVCVGNTQVGRTPSGQWYNQEHHAGTTTGILTDFKQGLVHAVDPSKVLGSWSIGGTGNCDVSYDYGGGHIYTYNVWRNGTNYTFCKISGPAVPPSNFTIPSTQIFGSVSPASCGAAP